MKYLSILILICSLFACGGNQKSSYENSTQSDERIVNSEAVKRIISESISRYDGNCPCPYSKASDNSTCGQRSAYSKSGGKKLYCYESDITIYDLTGGRVSNEQGRQNKIDASLDCMVLEQQHLDKLKSEQKGNVIYYIGMHFVGEYYVVFDSKLHITTNYSYDSYTSNKCYITTKVD